ncbi:MAG TPA: O-antigen ligase family protein [Bryobacteraceae bacterium]|jgi:O-antigen ligase
MRDAVVPKRSLGFKTVTQGANPALARAGLEQAPPDGEQKSDLKKRTYGSVLLGIYIFLLISRVLDISRIALLHIPMIMLGCLMIGALAQKGGWKGAISSKATLFYGALNVWILVCFPLSSWRGGSLPYVILSLESFVVYLIVVQLIKTSGDWRFVAGAYAYAVLVAAILSFFLSKTVNGRISLASGTLADPNEFALTLVLGLPFWFYKISEAGPLKKILYLGLTVPILISFGRAGSRSGLLALGALFLVMLLFAGVKQKAIMTGVAVLALVLGAVLLPDYLKARFTTLFSSSGGAHLDLEDRVSLHSDVASSEAREMLLRESLQLTVQHPIFGVGPGIFADSAWNLARTEGSRGGPAQVSHNTYTQLSSEIGIPGFLFFTLTMLVCAKYGISDYRRLSASGPSITKGSLYMFAAMAALAVGVFFLTLGYSMLLSVMFGLAVSLHGVANSETAGGETIETEQPALLPRRPAAPALKPKRIRNPVRLGRQR